MLARELKDRVLWMRFATLTQSFRSIDRPALLLVLPLRCLLVDERLHSNLLVLQRKRALEQ